MTNSINAGYSPETGLYGLWIYKDTLEVRSLLTDEGLQEHAPGTYREATAYLNKSQLEVLMSRLWDEGIRPSNWGHEGQVSALKDHLADMRRLVFNSDV